MSLLTKITTLFTRSNLETKAQHELKISTEADSAQAFGYKNKWLLVRTDSSEAVLAKLVTKHNQISNWESGIALAYKYSFNESENWVFVSPSIKGWVLLVGHGLPDSSAAMGETGIKLMMESLSKSFGDVQFYATHRVCDYVAWGVAKNGVISRLFSYADSSVQENTGNRLPAEFDLGMPNIDGLNCSDSAELLSKNLEIAEKVRQGNIDNFQSITPPVKIYLPNEDDPHLIARSLSFSPLDLASFDLPASTGYLVRI